MRGLARHWGILLLLAVAGPLLVAFAGSAGIASFGDDSVSYLVLARWMEGSARPLVSPWLAWHVHFGPLFPLLLALAGAAQDLARAHLVVAIIALAAIASTYRFALAATGRRDAAFVVAAVFMLTPTAWIGAKGILTEPLYLLVSMEALRFHLRCCARPAPRIASLAVLGILLGLAYLTRTAAIALLAAYAVHAAVRHARGGDSRHYVALVPAILLALAWIGLRPGGADVGYVATSGGVAQAWASHFGLLAREAPLLVFGGWVASFTNVTAFVGDASIPIASRVALGAGAAMALAGTAIRIRANALDGWYVLATLLMLVAWVFEEENMRRLLYPVIPPLLLHAGFAIAATCRRLGFPRHERLEIGFSVAVVVALSAPALLGIAAKTGDRAPLVAGDAVSAADMTEYYIVPNIGYSRAMAARHAAVLAGFAALGRVTPPDAKVMYPRPEYVAVLGARAAAPLQYAWRERDLAEAVRTSGAGYIVATSLSKSDVARARGDAMESARLAAPYTRRVFSVAGGAGKEDFVLLEVDREALARFLGAAR